MSDLAADIAWGDKKVQRNIVSTRWHSVIAAARQRLRLSRQPCQTCGGSGAVPYTYSQTIATVVFGTTHDNGGIQCPACNGSGGEWDAALIRTVAYSMFLSDFRIMDPMTEEDQANYERTRTVWENHARAALAAVESWMEAGE